MLTKQKVMGGSVKRSRYRRFGGGRHVLSSCVFAVQVLLVVVVVQALVFCVYG